MIKRMLLDITEFFLSLFVPTVHGKHVPYSFNTLEANPGMIKLAFENNIQECEKKITELKEELNKEMIKIDLSFDRKQGPTGMFRSVLESFMLKSKEGSSIVFEDFKLVLKIAKREDHNNAEETFYSLLITPEGLDRIRDKRESLREQLREANQIHEETRMEQKEFERRRDNLL